MQLRDKIVTAVCRTVDGIEWTSWLVKQDGNEQVEQDSASVIFSGTTTEELMASIELPEDVTERLAGEITVPLRASELLMRVMEFPSSDKDEIVSMVGFQVDKISPFPIDQLAVSHEILHQNEETSLVLMAASKRSHIDAIGEIFEKKGVRIHSIDARVLGWMKLLKDEGHLPDEGCEIIIIDDRIDFSLVVLLSGIPVAFRMLQIQTDDMDIAEELAYEISYTLTTLDTEHDLPPPTAIQFWNYDDLSANLRAMLSKKSGLPVHHHPLDSLPALYLSPPLSSLPEVPELQ